MGQFTAIKDFLSAIGQFFLWLGRAIRAVYLKVRNFCAMRLPFVRALIDRHTANPASVVVDLALFLLAVYFAFGVTGFVLTYPKKSDSRLTEVLGMLYPLPVAQVGDSFIWSHQYIQRVRFLKTFSQKTEAAGEVRELSDTDLRQQVFDGLVENKVIYLEAKERGIKVGEEEVNIAYGNLGNSDEVAQKIAENYGMSVNQFKAILAEQILKDKVKAASLTRIRVRHILISTQPVTQEVKGQIDAGKPFADAAKEYSQDAQSRDNGGDLGYWYKDELSQQISPGFEEVAFKLAVDQVSDPLQTQYGFHLIQVTEKTGDNYQAYAEWLQERRNVYKVKKFITP